MEKGYVIYTAGQRGIITARYAQAIGMPIMGFFDSNLDLQGKLVDGLKIWDRETLLKALLSRNINGFIIGNDTYKDEIIYAIQNDFGENMEIIEEDFVQSHYWEKIALPFRNSMKDRYEVLYDVQAKEWLDNIMSEVEYWIKNVASPKCRNFELYCKRINSNKPFVCKHLKQKVKANMVIVDAGCGVCSQYGLQTELGGQVQLIAVDPLAYYYNKINCKNLYGSEDNDVKFGMFEFLSSFIGTELADVILVDNALDHCIDPFKSILECLTVLKKDGVLSMRHRRSEAVFEGYVGLHKWNIDVDDKNNFIIWNNKNKINISNVLRKYAEVDIVIIEGQRRSDEFVQINITKREAFDIQFFYDMKKENIKMANVIQGCMRLMADTDINLRFAQMLEEM